MNVAPGVFHAILSLLSSWFKQASDTLEHQPMAWPVPYACAQLYHPGSGSSGSHHSRPQKPRSFWSAPRIATSGQVQRHSGFEWLCQQNRLRPEPNRFVRLDSEHAQSDGKSVNRGLPLLDTARGRDSWC